MIKINDKVVKFLKFPNGETRLELSSDEVRLFIDRKDSNTIFFKYEDDSDLIKLMFVKKYLDDLGCKKLTLQIQYMPYSRMDRSENNSPFTLKYVCKFINSLKFKEVIVIEPHSDVTCALLDNSFPVYITKDLLSVVKNEVSFNNIEDYIVFPDLGASKRYSDLGEPNVLIGHKNRDFKTGKITKLDIIGDSSNCEGKKAIILDDLTSYGGTFVMTSEILKELGFKEIYLLVAHAENSVFDGELFNHINKLFTTDSIISNQNDWNNKRYSNQLRIFEL